MLPKSWIFVPVALLVISGRVNSQTPDLSVRRLENEIHI